MAHRSFGKSLIVAALLPAAFTLGADAKKDASTPEAEKKVVVTANRVETPVEQVGSSVSVVTEKEIESLGHSDAQEALRAVPGLDLVRTGSRGGQVSLFMRGGESDHTGVFWDGFKVNGDGGQFNFENQTLDNVERIEILRGAAGSQYGANAVAGAVNFISKRGEGAPALRLTSGGGSLGTVFERARFSGGHDGDGYSLDAGYIHQQRARYENSDFDEESFGGRFDHKVSPATDLMFVVRSLRSESGVYTTSAGQRFNPPDPNDRKTRSDILTGLQVRSDLTDFWESRVKLFRYNQETKLDLLKDTPRLPGLDSSDFNQLTDYERLGADWQNSFRIGKAVRLVAGAEYENEGFKQESDFAGSGTDLDKGRHNNAGYAQAEVTVMDRLFLTGGVRVDKNSDFQSETTQRASAALLLPTDTKLRASYGTGIKVPTFFEIHGDAFTTGLKTLPQGVGVEDSRTYDAGVEQKLWGKRAALSCTGFYNEYDNMVEFAGTGYGQGGRARAEGIESEASVSPIDSLHLAVNWTYMETTVVETRTTGTSFIRGEPLLRRPRNMGSATARWNPWTPLELSAQVLYVGDRADLDFNADPTNGARVRNPAYTTVGASASYRFLEHWRLFATGRNLTDKAYEEIYGFPANHATFLGGLEFSIQF